MTTKHKFSLSNNPYVKGKILAIHSCEAPGLKDTWKMFGLSDEEIIELRNLLGSNHCDGCPAFQKFMEQPKYVANLDSDLVLLSRKYENFSTSILKDLQMIRDRIVGLERDLSGHAGEHMKNNLVEKVKNLERFKEQHIQYDRSDRNSTLSRVWELNGKVMALTKSLNDNHEEIHKIKNFLGMKF